MSFSLLLVLVAVACIRTFYVCYLSAPLSTRNENISFYYIVYIRGVGKIIIKCKIKKKRFISPIFQSLLSFLQSSLPITSELQSRRNMSLLHSTVFFLIYVTGIIKTTDIGVSVVASSTENDLWTLFWVCPSLLHKYICSPAPFILIVSLFALSHF